MRTKKTATINIHSLEDYMALIRDFLNLRGDENYNIDFKIGGHFSITADQLADVDSKAHFLARATYHYIHQSARNVMQRRREITSLLSVAISQAKERDAAEQPLESYPSKLRVDALKNAIAGDKASWKQALLGIRQVELVKSSGAEHVFSRDVMSDDSTVAPANRVGIKALESKAEGVSAAVAAGSTFVTNKMPIIKSTLDDDKNPKPHVTLDAAYSTVTEDGFTVAIADGCGGHFDNTEDSAIRRAAKFNVKNASRLIGTYSAADLANKDFRSAFFDTIARETMAKNPKHGSAATSTLIVARGVNQADGSVQLYGVGVGDCSLVGYNPKTGEVYNFIAACQKGWGTASVPGTRTRVEEQYFSVNIPADTIILPLTDGVTDDLHSVTEVSGDVSFSKIKGEQLREILSPLGDSPSAQDCLTVIMSHVCNRVELKRLAAKEGTPELAGLLARSQALRTRLDSLQREQTAHKAAAELREADLRPEEKVYDNFVESEEFTTENDAIKDSQARVQELFCQEGDDVTALAVVPALTQGFYASQQHTLFKPKAERVAADDDGTSEAALLSSAEAPIVATKHTACCGKTRLDF
ncbi:MAG: hypothetical protein P1U40_00960 [Coxiellaceae bacterium]|nr:hypothetical protein [Coxiellaceae bacterium]